jgi:succinyl-diaminopimelate desuccinylase
LKPCVEILRNLVSFTTTNNPNEGKKPSREILDYINDTILSPIGYKSMFYEENQYSTLVSYIGEGDPKILFIGHCDVVPPGPGWVTDPFEFIVKGDYAYGRGTADMKGAVAVMLSLAKKLADQNNCTIIYAITLDEESGGQSGAGLLLPFLKKKNLIPHYVINGDTNGLQIVNRRRNSYVITFELPKNTDEIQGKIASKTFKTEIAGNRTMHAAYFMKDLDKHCMTKASEFLSQHNYKVQKINGPFVKNNVLPSEVSVDYIIPDEKSEINHEYDSALTFFMYSISDYKNIDVPSDPSDYGINLTFNYYKAVEKHFCQLDLRIMSNDDEEIKKYFKEIAERYSIVGDIDVKGSVGPVNTPITSPLIEKGIQVAKEMNLSSIPIEMGGATDSRFFSAYNIPTIEFGPLGSNVHGANESVKISSLEIVRKFYYKLITELVKLH